MLNFCSHVAELLNPNDYYDEIEAETSATDKGQHVDEEEEEEDDFDQEFARMFKELNEMGEEAFNK